MGAGPGRRPGGGRGAGRRSDPDGTAEYRSKDFCDDVVHETSVGMLKDMLGLKPNAHPGIAIPVIALWHTLGGTACLAGNFLDLTEEEDIELGVSVGLGLDAPGRLSVSSVARELQALATQADKSVPSGSAAVRGTLVHTKWGD